MDSTYGPYLDPVDNKWRMGDKEFIIEDDSFKVEYIKYPVTEGLRELLFKKKPQNVYNEKDLANYKILLESTKSHLGKDGRVKSNSGYKYMNLIRPLFHDGREPYRNPKALRLNPFAGKGM